MLGKLLAAFSLLLAAPLAAQSTVNDPIPLEYQGDTVVKVQFSDPMQVEWFCLDGNWSPDYIIYACYKKGKDRIIMPNPCRYPEADTIGSFAHLMCHEMAHKNGWRHKLEASEVQSLAGSDSLRRP